MQLSANIASEEKNDSCSVPEHEFQDDNRSRKLCMLLIVVFTVICVLASIIVVIYTVKLEHCHNDTVSANGSAEYGDNKRGPRIITRREWLAQLPQHPGTPLHQPVPYVIVLHTASASCDVQEECILAVRKIQTLHMESNGWWDIGYNFLIGGDGLVYEARGWNNTGAFAHGFNNKSIGIAFIGAFDTHLPTPQQIAAGKSLIELGVETGRVAADYKLLAHSQVSRTMSPGERFFEELKTWPHWAQTP